LALVFIELSISELRIARVRRLLTFAERFALGRGSRNAVVTSVGWLSWGLRFGIIHVSIRPF